jgi:hypothetical protein
MNHDVGRRRHRSIRDGDRASLRERQAGTEEQSAEPVTPWGKSTVIFQGGLPKNSPLLWGNAMTRRPPGPISSAEVR